jgi:hypothetical protein
MNRFTDGTKVVEITNGVEDIYRISLEVHHTIQENVRFVYDNEINLWRVQLTDNSGNYLSEIGAINFDPNENIK